jgi:predicted lipid carrier protein YhbT
VADFLTDAWFSELEAAAASADVPTSLQFAIEQTLEGDPGHHWQVRIADGVVIVDRDPSTEADVRLTTDVATARGIHEGRVSAQRAFLDGRLQIGGDVQALMAHRETLAELGLGLA